jgi:hypothetical protein
MPVTVMDEAIADVEMKIVGFVAAILSRGSYGIQRL